VDPDLLAAARVAIGFMPDDEGLALHGAGLSVARRGPLLEVGTYCGKSALYLGAAAREAGSVLFTVDHHRGSEENQRGWEYHDERLEDPVDPQRLDTLPWFRRTIARAGLEETVIAVVGPSALVARHWSTPLALVFVDGSHTQAAVEADYEGWAPHVMPGGLLVIHDVFPDPAQGGQAPYEVYRRALRSGAFALESTTGSLQVLRRVGRGPVS
jgi:predicted O-methyltransferase YrrM